MTVQLWTFTAALYPGARWTGTAPYTMSPAPLGVKVGAGAAAAWCPMNQTPGAGCLIVMPEGGDCFLAGGSPELAGFDLCLGDVVEAKNARSMRDPQRAP